MEGDSTWTDAQTYCRSKYSDLAIVQNVKQLAGLNQLIGSDQYVWIGLYPDIGSWRWSLENQDYYTAGGARFRNWASEPAARKQVVQVVLEKSDSSVDMEELKEEVLQKFSQTLKDQGLEEDVRLSWVEGPDGKIFQKIKRPVP
ncbi:hypothetical protein Q8A73_016800 [Channa argus]|nr:hypothetical protein Q8A73_016800 [Channa argus]